MESIKISVSESGHADNISVVRVDGVIDTLTATQLEEVLDKLLKRGRFNIILDLAGVDYISSAGWGIFISRIKEIRENKGDIKLGNMVPNVFEIYELLEFDNILSAYDNVNSARTAFGNPKEPAAPKKKVLIAGDRTTIEELPTFSSQDAASAASPAGNRIPAGDNDLEEERAIIRAVIDDPFYTISELKLMLMESFPRCHLSWWGIFKVLKRNRLLSRRARFRYARRHHKRP